MALARSWRWLVLGALVLGVLGTVGWWRGEPYAVSTTPLSPIGSVAGEGGSLSKGVSQTASVGAGGLSGEGDVSGRERALVRAVVDGDTIEVELEGGTVERVRYIGIDTPETVHPSKPVECFGREASARNKELVGGKEVLLERDTSDRDRYGRLLRYVYVGGALVNEALVGGGFAHASPYPPDVRYEARFRNAERQAREERAGLWGAVCEQASAAVAPPAPALQGREASVTTPTPAPTTDASVSQDGCTIKGNINVKGEKIYHLPGCGSYEKTVVSEASGERWFCTEADARAAGWRKAQNCP